MHTGCMSRRLIHYTTRLQQRTVQRNQRQQTLRATILLDMAMSETQPRWKESKLATVNKNPFTSIFFLFRCFVHNNCLGHVLLWKWVVHEPHCNRLCITMHNYLWCIDRCVLVGLFIWVIFLLDWLDVVAGGPKHYHTHRQTQTQKRPSNSPRVHSQHCCYTVYWFIRRRTTHYSIGECAHMSCLCACMEVNMTNIW